MKYSILFVVIFSFMISCEQGGSKRESSKGFAEITPEENLKKQFNEYSELILTGDIDVIKYLYSGIFKDIRESLPEAHNLSDKRIFEIVFNEAQFLTEVNSGKIKVNFEIIEIYKKIQFENKMVYRISTLTTVTSNDSEKDLEGDVIAVSFDNGKNWKFVENEPDSIKKVLSYDFSESEINKIFD